MSPWWAFPLLFLAVAAVLILTPLLVYLCAKMATLGIYRARRQMRRDATDNKKRCNGRCECRH